MNPALCYLKLLALFIANRYDAQIGHESVNVAMGLSDRIVCH